MIDFHISIVVNITKLKLKLKLNFLFKRFTKYNSRDDINSSWDFKFPLDMEIVIKF